MPEARDDGPADRSCCSLHGIPHYHPDHHNLQAIDGAPLLPLEDVWKLLRSLAVLQACGIAYA